MQTELGKKLQNSLETIKLGVDQLKASVETLNEDSKEFLNVGELAACTAKFHYNLEVFDEQIYTSKSKT